MQRASKAGFRSGSLICVHICPPLRPSNSLSLPPEPDMVILFRDTPYLPAIICDAMRIYGLYFVSQLINSPGSAMLAAAPAEHSSPIIRDCDGLQRDNGHKSRSGF